MTTHRILSVGNTAAVRVTPNGLHSGMDITIQNLNESGNVYVGGDGTTTTSYGYRITPGGAISFELAGSDDIFVVAEEADSQVAVLEIGLESQN